jgi:hypothetical protein
MQQADAYHGEVEAKGDVQVSFLRAIAGMTDPGQARAAYPALVAIWDKIFRTVETSMGEARKTETARFFY